MEATDAMGKQQRRSILTVATAILWASVVAQTAPDTWWVQFTDKANTPYSIEQPLEFLSQRAVERRQAQGIPVDELDLPVDPAYVGAVLALGEVELVNRSRWFNAITIRTSDPAVLEAIDGLPFVSVVRGTRTLRAEMPGQEKFGVPAGMVRGGGEEPYGPSYLQIAMMNGHLLHELEAQGQGMLIGVLDSGFDNVDVLDAFTTLRDRNGILLTKDMVNAGGNIYAEHWHGRSVLSCMAAELPGQLVGTAPQADYALVRTEAVAYELLIEEDNWVSGAELLDSLGADVLNTSLGYTRFDWVEQDHSYADMDGQTTRISIAAGIAATRGMVPVVSAGNQGGSEWFHISAPADAMGILAVGAVGDQEQPAPFSSRGPSADGRVKPDVTAMGWGTIALGFDGTEVTGVNGTSFSGPLVAGLVACLWQLHPERSAAEIMDAVRSTASRADDPDAEMGHGIPDFMAAHALLTSTTGITELNAPALRVFPVPFRDRLTVELDQDLAAVELSLFDASGRTVLQRQGLKFESGKLQITDPVLASLPEGLYVLRIRSGDLVQQATVVRTW